MGFVICVSDTCVFVRQDDDLLWVYVTLYVDDVLIGGISGESIKKVADKYGAMFDLRFWEKAVEYEANTKQLKISQSACIARMVEKYTKSIQNRYTIRVWKAKSWSNVKKGT
ncbi:hypothetical protein KXD40_005474 [Peronospora effusa]|nr:hypothetical protein KXD40_005474 [Peronospora effusa]